MTARGVGGIDAVNGIALSGAQAQEWYLRTYGENISRTTITSDFAAMFGQPVGALPGRWSDRANLTVAAKLYTLRHVGVTLGKLGKRLSSWIAKYLLELDPIGRHRPTTALTLSPIYTQRLAEDALERAIEDAYPGQRHAILCRLTARLAHLGLPEPDIVRLATEYAEVVGLSRDRAGSWQDEVRSAAASATRKFGLARTTSSSDRAVSVLAPVGDRAERGKIAARRRPSLCSPAHESAVTAANIPQELRDREQWVTWRHVDQGERSAKVPYQHNGHRASVTKPQNWTTCRQAQTCLDEATSGIGYVFSEMDPYVGFDLDGCLDGAGNLHPDAFPIVEQLNSYTEVSPSGRGLHIFVRGRIPEGCKHRVRTTWGSIEVYDRARYFTMTGDHWPDSPTSIRECHIDRVTAVLALVAAT